MRSSIWAGIHTPSVRSWRRYLDNAMTKWAISSAEGSPPVPCATGTRPCIRGRSPKSLIR